MLEMVGIFNWSVLYVEGSVSCGFFDLGFSLLHIFFFLSMNKSVIFAML
jgi:hypothetical protein